MKKENKKTKSKAVLVTNLDQMHCCHGCPVAALTLEVFTRKLVLRRPSVSVSLFPVLSFTVNLLAFIFYGVIVLNYVCNGMEFCYLLL